MIKHDANHGSRSIFAYSVGYILSLGLTLLAYLLVTQHGHSRQTLIAAIVGLALVQFLVQLIFFLHVGDETKPKWNFLALLFMILVVSILVFGSIWIMNSLDYNHPHTVPPSETDSFIIKDEGVGQ